MDLNELREFFDLHVKSYLPYRDNLVFRAVMDYLTEYYFQRLYLETPTEFRELFENQNLLTSIYDQLLAALGVPDDIVRKLVFLDKIIILSALHDFQRYKASVGFFQAVGKSFNDRFNIYELYYDREDSGWVLKPRLIHRHPLVEVLTDVAIPYEEVYRKVFTLLIPEEQLEELHQSGRAVFPMKSNLLLLDYTFFTEASSMISLAVATFLKDYGNLEIPLYFSDWSTSLSIRGIWYLWHLLMTRRWGTTWLGSLSAMELLRFSSDPAVNPYHVRPPLDDWHLDRIMERFDSIHTRGELDLFRKEVLERWFLARFRGGRDMAWEDMAQEFSHEELWNYLDSRVAIDPENEIPRILEEIFNSCLAFQYFSDLDPMEREWFRKYFAMLLGQLPQLAVRPDKTTSWLLLYNFKPFHTEFIQRVSTGILVDDKLNAVWLDSGPEGGWGRGLWFVLELSQVSALHLSKSFAFTAFERTVTDSLKLPDRTTMELMFSSLETVRLLRDEWFAHLKFVPVTALCVGDFNTRNIAAKMPDPLCLEEKDWFFYSFAHVDDPEVEDRSCSKVEFRRHSVSVLGTDAELEWIKTGVSAITPIGAASFDHRFQEKERVGHDWFFVRTRPEGASALHLGDGLGVTVLKPTSETTVLADAYEIF